jgi:pSer/pThr/pTyr-binding forkhead associated (FHA) protein
MSDEKTDHLSEALTTNLSGDQNSEMNIGAIDELSIPERGISFYIVRISRAVTVDSDGDNFFIGRSPQENFVGPMLNLEDLDGFAMGISRRHALIRLADQGYEVIDLASRNGTWLDGQRLVPNKAYPLKSGSLLRVGQERMLIRYNS